MKGTSHRRITISKLHRFQLQMRGTIPEGARFSNTDEKYLIESQDICMQETIGRERIESISTSRERGGEGGDDCERS